MALFLLDRPEEALKFLDCAVHFAPRRSHRAAGAHAKGQVLLRAFSDAQGATECFQQVGSRVGAQQRTGHHWTSGRGTLTSSFLSFLCEQCRNLLDLFTFLLV